MESRLPTAPPLACDDLPPLEGRAGPDPEDFRVDEQPAYDPCGEGEHWYVQIEKRLLSTPELTRILARLGGVPEREIGYAGMKDKHAVTSQWLSLPRNASDPATWVLPENLRLLACSRHGNKLRTGHLKGNRFTLRLVGLHADAQARLPGLLERLRRGTFDGYAEQRFGFGGENLPRALEHLRDPRKLRGPKARMLSKLYPSVLQSELFNRYLWARKNRGLDQLLSGEVVRLEGSSANFVVEDLQREQPRYAKGDIHPQGPIFGPKMRPAGDAARALELEVLADSGIDEELLNALGREAPGARRDLWLTPTDMSAEFLSDGSLRLAFSLPAGAYATQLLRELTREPWLSRGRRPAASSETASEATDGVDPDQAPE